jgi:glycosyltransferase involved in cell wall biosynthesis
VSRGRPAQLAVVAVGDPESPDTWSGITFGVLGALRSLGVGALPLDLTLPAGIERAMLLGSAASTRNRYDAQAGALAAGVRSRRARRGLAGRAVDGVVQVGTTFALPPGVPYVTLEDMTLRQAAEIHPVFSRMSAPVIASWEKRRGVIYERARMCAVASSWAAESLRSDYSVARAHVAVVGFGANHRPQTSVRSFATPRFLFVGIDWERKGGPLLLRAFSRLRAVCPQARLDVVGGHPRLEQAGVHGHGVLSPRRAADTALMAELFARATCLVLPSQVEPFGIVHVEAASAGIPSIGSSVGGPRDVIGADGGLLVDPGDEQGLFTAMHRLSDPALAVQMGQAALARAPLYTWSKVAERLLRALGLPAPNGRTLADFI